VEIYRKLLARDPEDAETYLAAARAYEVSGDAAQGGVCRTIARAFTAGRAVEDVRAWAEKRADRAPDSALAETLRARGLPQSIRVVTDTGRSSVEAWVYRIDRRVDVFQEGARQGSMTWR
jgi:hypothetical protein